MTQLRPVWLLIILIAACLTGFLATALMSAAGYSSPGLPMSSAVTLAAVGLIVAGLGIAVWRDQRRLRQRRENHRRAQQDRSFQPGWFGSGRRLHPLQAARVVAAGQACAYAGALIAGWHAGIILNLVPAAGLTTPNVISSAVMVIGGLLWVVIGYVVESLCRLPPEDGEDPQGGELDYDDGTEPHAAF